MFLMESNERTVAQILNGNLCPGCAPNCEHYSDKINGCICKSAVGRMFVCHGNNIFETILRYTPHH